MNRYGFSSYLLVLVSMSCSPERLILEAVPPSSLSPDRLVFEAWPPSSLSPERLILEAVPPPPSQSQNFSPQDQIRRILKPDL